MNHRLKLASFIKKYRTKAGLSQKDLAFQLGYTSAQFISNWERGQAAPPANILAKLVSALDAPKNEIFDIMLQLSKEKLQESLYISKKKKSGS